jgi:hypothetical protein
VTWSDVEWSVYRIGNLVKYFLSFIKNRRTTEIYLHTLGNAEREAIAAFERARSSMRNSHTESHGGTPKKQQALFLHQANPLKSLVPKERIELSRAQGPLDFECTNKAFQGIPGKGLKLITEPLYDTFSIQGKPGKNRGTFRYFLTKS